MNIMSWKVAYVNWTYGPFLSKELMEESVAAVDESDDSAKAFKAGWILYGQFFLAKLNDATNSITKELS